MSVRGKMIAAGLIVAATIATNLNACQVPVFRYALERWPADKYAIVAVTNGEMDNQTTRAIETLHALAANELNAVIEFIDLAELTEAELWSVEGLEDTDQSPMLQVYYPERDGQRKV